VTSEKAQSGLAGRYANAVFELAGEQKAIDAVSADLAALARAIHATPDLARLVRSQAIGHAQQGAAMNAMMEKMGLGKLAANLVLTLAAKRRLAIVLQVIGAYEHLVAKARGETEAEVTAARALGDSEIADLKAVLKSRLGKEPRLTTRIDPRLLGGLVVKVGSRMIDSSLRTKLDGLRAAMRG
jgi:F-type H+-transporting ATPase subunit delta